jgi:glyoxylase-like metal-dependent hydrolase (beta-lactamase superfamily II)
VARAFPAEAAEWFWVSELEPGLHIVAEPGHVFSYLIAGSERSLLLDTGMGLADVSAAIAPVAKSPVSVVNSHTDFDHVGGNELFDDVAMHEAGPEWMQPGKRPSSLDAYGELVADLHPDWERLRAVDREAFFLIGPEEAVRPWPTEGVKEAGWRIDPPPPTRLLREGDVVDLGDRTLRVLHTPGHAADHICLVDEAAGILFAQDMAYYGPHLVYEPGSDLADFTRSARRLADELTGQIRIVYCAHSLRPAIPPRFLTELADAAEALAAGEAEIQPMKGLFGEAVAGVDHGHFSILIDPESSAATHSDGPPST